MKKTVFWLIFLISTICYLVSSVDSFTKWTADTRLPESKAWWGSDKYKYGDLYGMTYVSKFKAANSADEVPVPKPVCAPDGATYNLFALSDSYTWDIFKDATNFCNVKTSRYAASNFRDVLPVQINKSERNIIVIETTERNVRALLADTAYLQHFIKVVPSGQPNPNFNSAKKRKEFRFDYKLKDADANFEFNLWDYRFLSPLKEFKANLTYNWFARTASDAVSSPGGQFLLYKPTVDTTYLESSFKPVSDRQIDQIVAALNGAREHYRQLGFQEVYLAIIPNPVTILYPNYHGLTYNGLIPRIQQHLLLKTKVFDAYTLFKNHPDKKSLYRISDTHWTAEGRDLWLTDFRRFLNQALTPKSL